MSGSQPQSPAPSLASHLGVLAWLPVGVALSALRHVGLVPWIVRSNTAGDPGDLPPTLPDEHLDTRSKPASQGHGPLFRRTFAVTTDDADVDAAGLIDRLVADLDRPAPFGVVTFHKTHGRCGRLELGDEYVVRMPAPWDGPVRVVHRDATSFRLATLNRHLEAGQIEFRARDDVASGRLCFEIEAWSVAGDRWARLLYADLPVGREVQLALWVQYALAVVRLAGGHRDGPVHVHTRRLDRPAEHAADPART